MRRYFAFSLLAAAIGMCAASAQQFSQMPGGNGGASAIDAGYFAGNDNQAGFASVPVVQYASPASNGISDSVYPANGSPNYSNGFNGNCNGGCGGNCNGGCGGNCNGGCGAGCDGNCNGGWNGRYNGNGVRVPFGGGFFGGMRANHANRPGFSDTLCTDACTNCWPQDYPEYLAFFGGWGDAYNFERKLHDAANGWITEISGAGLDNGYAAGGAIGWVVHPLARTELEFTYRRNNVDSFQVTEYASNVPDTSTTVPATGNVQAYTAMWNFLVHTEPRRLGCASLYGGGGIGAIWADGSFATATDAYSVGDPSFAYQFIAGVNYVVSARLDTYVEYRYLGADYLQVQNNTTNVSMGDFTWDSNLVVFGVRFGR